MKIAAMAIGLWMLGMICCADAGAGDVLIPQYNVLTGEVTTTVRHAPWDEPLTEVQIRVRLTLIYENVVDCSYYHFWPPHYSWADTEERCRASAEYETQYGMEGWVGKVYREMGRERTVERVGQ